MWLKACGIPGNVWLRLSPGDKHTEPPGPPLLAPPALCRDPPSQSCVPPLSPILGTLNWEKRNLQGQNLLRSPAICSETNCATLPLKSILSFPGTHGRSSAGCLGKRDANSLLTTSQWAPHLQVIRIFTTNTTPVRLCSEGLESGISSWQTAPMLRDRFPSSFWGGLYLIRSYADMKSSCFLWDQCYSTLTCDIWHLSKHYNQI